MSSNINIQKLKKYIKFNETCSQNLQQLKLTELVQKFSVIGKITPTNNIVLFIELQNDGTGDYGWIKEYINIFESIGYPLNKIYIIPIFEFKFGNFDKIISGVNSFALNDFYNIYDYLNKIITSAIDTDKFKYELTSINLIEENINKIKQYLNEINEQISSNRNSKIIINTDKILNNAINFGEEITHINNQFKTYKTVPTYEANKILINEMCLNILTSTNKLCIISEKFIELLNSIFDNFIKFLELFKFESYVFGVNYYITDMSVITMFNEEGSFFEKKLEKCNLLNDIDFLTNSIIITFTSINFLTKEIRKCKNFKLIEMQEGGMTMAYGQNVLSSGIGDNLLGLYKSFNNSMLNDQNQNLINLKNKVSFNSDEKEIFNTLIKYHYAYIGQLEGKYYGQLTKFLVEQILLFNLIENGQTHYLFGYNGVTKDIKPKYELIFGMNINFIQKVISFYNFFNITQNSQQIKIKIYENSNNYDIVDTLNNKFLKIRFFQRLNKKDFLTMAKYASSPIFSTGDLSTQEALLLDKYVIHDYISNKQLFVNNFLNTFNRSIGISGNSINKFYELFNLINEMNINEIFYDGQRKKNISEIITTNIINEFKVHITNYLNFKSSVIDIKYNFNNNFSIILIIMSLCDLNIKIPNTKSNETGEQIIKNTLINIANESSQNICTIMGGQINENISKQPSNDSDQYYQKYLKYKQKYLKLKSAKFT